VETLDIISTDIVYMLNTQWCGSVVWCCYYLETWQMVWLIQGNESVMFYHFLMLSGTHRFATATSWLKW